MTEESFLQATDKEILHHFIHDPFKRFSSLHDL